MKLGAEDSKKTILAVGLFIIALFLVLRMLSSGGTTAGNQAKAQGNSAAQAPVRRAAGRRATRTTAKPASGPLVPSLDPRLKLSTLQATENTDYTGKGRNIFLAQANDVEIPQPVAPAKKPTPPPQSVVQAPPPPPPIDLKFFGFASSQGVKRVFLARGEDIFVAGEGDIVNRRYKIVKINANNIEVLDVLNNNRQTIPLTAG